MLSVGDKVQIYRMRPEAKQGRYPTCLVRNKDGGTITSIRTDGIGRRYGYRYMSVKFDRPVEVINCVDGTSHNVYSLEFFENKDDRKLGRIRNTSVWIHCRKCEG